MERRLAAILATDVVGYSRLMGLDEAGTLERLKALRRELVQPKIKERKGRIVKFMGDGLIAEFASVVEAVQCAVEIQEAMSRREGDVATDGRIRLRIGINLGDIIVEGSDIYGDGVNVAARLEGLADPGGVCISGQAFDAIEGKLELVFEDLGLQQVKNIAKPVRAYRLAGGTQKGAPPARSLASLPLPEKPSIAVLPFNNMSGDPEQEYFSDGITEDIITALSRFDRLFVIARNSSFVFRGKAVDVGEVGRKLGVRYVVEGSVRRAGDRVRVTAQLINAAKGNHLWADRYDRDLEDIFAVQDEVVRSIVATLAERVSAVEVERGKRRPIADMAVYDLILRAYHHMGSWTAMDYFEARELLLKAVALDAGCAQAHAALAWCCTTLTWFEGETDQPRKMALEAGRRALSLDSHCVDAHTGLGWCYLSSGEHAQALHHYEMALKLNPNSADTHIHLGYGYAQTGDIEKGLDFVRLAMRLNPLPPDFYFESQGEVLYLAGDYAAAIESFKRMSHLAPWTHGYLAACLAQSGRADEARAEVALFEDTAKEGYTPIDYLEMEMLLYGAPVVKEHWLEGYRKAGLKV